jgi:leader peptidase (prepilin peptidase)/N-methyltransferase
MFGILIGSFLNTCIYRIPRNISIIRPRSFCTQCGKQLKWWQNIPLLSFVLLGGKCSYCNQLISWQYPLIELGTGILSAALFYTFTDIDSFILFLFFSYFLLVITVIDASFYKIPNRILLYLLLKGLIMNLAYDIIPWHTAIIGFLSSGIFLFSIRGLGYLTLKKEALGIGDIKLAAVVGFYLGFTNFLIAILVGSTIAILVSIFLYPSSDNFRYQKIPMAPYLSLGILVILIFW